MTNLISNICSYSFRLDFIIIIIIINPFLFKLVVQGDLALSMLLSALCDSLGTWEVAFRCILGTLGGQGTPEPHLFPPSFGGAGRRT